MKIVPRNVLLVTSAASSLSTYHQVYKIHKAKNAKHISKVNVMSVWTNMVANLAYAVSIKNTRLICTFGNSAVSLSAFLGSTFYYS